MSKEAVLRQLLQKMGYSYDNIITTSGLMYDMVSLCENAMELYKSDHAKSGWIKLEDNQPPINEPVYVVDANEKEPKNSINICRLYEIRTVKTSSGITVSYEWHEGKSGYDEWYYEVTHWMPLPEPPKI